MRGEGVGGLELKNWAELGNIVRSCKIEILDI